MATGDRQSELHPLVGGFADAAGYDRARPRYDARVAELLVAELGLQDGSPVLELGAGTGQLSAALIAAGLDLIAVEPLKDTRTILAAAIGAERVRAGRAEEIPLPDASVQAVMAADAFHWFDEARAMPEIKRVLRPGGGVAILRTAPAIEEPWSRELGEIDHRAASGAPRVQRAQPRGGAGGGSRVRAGERGHVTTRRELDREAIVAFVAQLQLGGDAARRRRASECSRESGSCSPRTTSQRESYDVLNQVWLARLR